MYKIALTEKCTKHLTGITIAHGYVEVFATKEEAKARRLELQQSGFIKVYIKKYKGNS